MAVGVETVNRLSGSVRKVFYECGTVKEMNSKKSSAHKSGFFRLTRWDGGSEGRKEGVLHLC